MNIDLQPEPQAVARRGGAARGAWLLPGILAAAAGVIMTLLAGAVRVPGPGAGAAVPTGTSEAPELMVTRLDWLPVGGEVRESLRLLDPARLFLPTRQASDTVNVAEGIVDRPGGRVTETFPAALAFSNLLPAGEILHPTPPRSPASALEAATASHWFEGLARIDASAGVAEAGPLAMRATGRMDVYRLGGGAERERMAETDVPPDPILDAVVWEPVELSVLINAAGTVAAPMVTVGSGVGEVDERVRTLVRRELLPRLRLRPGAYRLVVGP